MLAVRFYGIRDVRIENVPIPAYGPEEVLIKVKYGGICGSDLHIFKKGMFVGSTPVVMGHEFSGIIEKVGSKVKDLSPGDYVVGDPRVPCNKCKWCQEGLYHLCPELGFIGEVSPGCFAEYLAMDAKKLFKIPSSIDFKVAALVEPLAVALHIVQYAHLSPNEIIGIVGAGPIGLLALLVAQMIAKNITVIDISPFRLSKAKLIGATKVLQEFPLNPSEKVDVVIEVTGSKETLNKSLEWINPGGRLVLGGIYENKVQLDPNNIVFKEIKLTGINAYNTEDIKKAIELISNNYINVEVIITDILPLSEAVKGFELLTAAVKKSIKILLEV